MFDFSYRRREYLVWLGTEGIASDSPSPSSTVLEASSSLSIFSSTETSTSASEASSPSANRGVAAHKGSSSLKLGTIATGVIAGIILIAGMLAGGYYFRRRRSEGPIATSLPQHTLKVEPMRIYVGSRTPSFDVTHKSNIHVLHTQDPEDPTTYPPAA